MRSPPNNTNLQPTWLKMQPPSRLCNNITQWLNPIPRKWHDTACRYQCGLPSHSQSPYPHHWKTLPYQLTAYQRNSKAKTERPHYHHLTNTQTCCGHRRISINRRDVPQWTRNGPYLTHPDCHRTPSTRQRTYPQSQHKNWSWNCLLFHEAKMLQIMGHEIPLDRRTHKSWPHQSLLGMRNI